MITSSSLKICPLKGPLPKQYIKDLARLRIALFRDYPFLYDGSLSYEEKYLEPYTKSADFFVVLVFDNNRIVGASTAMPLQQEPEEFQEPFLKQGLDVSRYCYFGESILEHEYRRQGIGRRFFEEREAHARDLNLPCTCFCTVRRDDDHPKRPAGFQGIEAFWQKLGYKKQADIAAKLSWKEIGEVEETAKEMPFWTKNL